jgi:hypothetical protein
MRVRPLERGDRSDERHLFRRVEHRERVMEHTRKEQNDHGRHAAEYYTP